MMVYIFQENSLVYMVTMMVYIFQETSLVYMVTMMVYIFQETSLVYMVTMMYIFSGEVIGLYDNNDGIYFRRIPWFIW